MEVDKCSDDEYEVVAESSPRPRTVSLDPHRPSTEESLVSLGSSPSKRVSSSPNAATLTVVSGGDKDERVDSDTSSRRWNPRALLSRTSVFLVFIALIVGIGVLIKELQKLQMREAHRVELMKENRKLHYTLQDRDAQITTLAGKHRILIKEHEVSEAERQTLKTEKQGLVKKIEDTESERILLDDDNHSLVKKLRALWNEKDDLKIKIRSQQEELQKCAASEKALKDAHDGYKVLLKEKQDLVKELDAKESQRVILVGEKEDLVKKLNDKEAQRLTLVKEKQGLVKERDNKEFERYMLSIDMQTLENKICSREHSDTSLSGKIERLNTALTDTMEALIDCQTSGSTAPQISLWKRMRSSVSLLIPLHMWIDLLWVTSDWWKEALIWLQETLVWLREHGLRYVDYVPNSYEKPKLLDVEHS